MWLNVAAAEVPGFYGWISSGAKLIGLVLSLLKLENIRFNQIISALQLPLLALLQVLHFQARAPKLMAAIFQLSRGERRRWEQSAAQRHRMAGGEPGRSGDGPGCA